MNATLADPAIESAFRAHRRALWGMLYRLTGSAPDSDELVQETFVRLLERPPADLERAIKPWLLKVAMNLGLDSLRARRRRAYIGPWLPTPVEIEDASEVPAFEPVTAAGVSTEGRYDLLESVSLAFLVALEALTPRQRAVLLLRDVFDYSVEDTAAALGITAANVKTVHHRARRAMDRYDARRVPIDERKRNATRDAVERFVSGLASRDLGKIEALLNEDAREISDGAGEYLAALRPIVGARNVARFFLGISSDPSYRYTMRSLTLNGLPALLVTLENPPPRVAPRFVLAIDADLEGTIRDLYTVVAPRKISHIDAAR
jgi:RNA polymerase sigma-70 factor (ECF subfamily)